MNDGKSLRPQIIRETLLHHRTRENNLRRKRQKILRFYLRMIAHRRNLFRFLREITKLIPADDLPGTTE